MSGSSWDDVTEGGGGANFLKVEAGESIVVHVLDGAKGPKVFHSVFFKDLNRGATVDPKSNPLGGLEGGYDIKKRYAFTVVDMSDGQVKAFACGSQVANAIKGIFTEYGNLDEMDVKISRQGSGLKTKYTVLPVKLKFTDEMIEGQEMPDLDEVFALTPDEDIEKLMRGEDPRADSEGAKPAPKKKAAPAPAEEPEEEDPPAAAGEDDPPAAEEEPAPAPKKAAPAAVASGEASRATLLQSIKANFAKLKRYANPKQQLTDIQHYGGKDKQALSQLETAALQKLLNFQKTAK